ncbi:multiubiquitin domain-containing protein [Streptomyces clavifer]|uniref:multiubiquitin domain-containing protein n=1 Tax=Streptomyces clavifer TaxID=68188 RepID=UPI00380BE881
MSQDNQKPKPVTIIVNARPHTWEAKDITYEQAVELAYPGQQPNDQDTYTVRYSRGHNGHGTGSLTASHSVRVKKEMVFDVYRTSRS